MTRLGTLLDFGIRLYRFMTAKTVTRSIFAILMLVITLLVFATGSMGYLSGADAAMDGDSVQSLDTDTQEMAQIEHEIWTDMGDEPALVRSFYGLFHWLIALSIWLATLAAKLGYASPAVANILVHPIRLFPWVFVALLASQAVRIIELVVRDVA